MGNQGFLPLQPQASSFTIPEVGMAEMLELFSRWWYEVRWNDRAVTIVLEGECFSTAEVDLLLGVVVTESLAPLRLLLLTVTYRRRPDPGGP